MSMYNPSHPGELIRDSLEAEGWTVTECAARLGVAECAARLGVARHTLSRPLDASPCRGEGSQCLSSFRAGGQDGRVPWM